MYVCMYVCMHAYMQACMFVCMYVCTYVRMDVHTSIGVRMHFHIFMYLYAYCKSECLVYTIIKIVKQACMSARMYTCLSVSLWVCLSFSYELCIHVSLSVYKYVYLSHTNAWMYVLCPRLFFQCRVENHKHNRPYHPAPFPTHLRWASRIVSHTEISHNTYAEECVILVLQSRKTQIQSTLPPCILSAHTCSAHVASHRGICHTQRNASCW